MKVDLRSAGGHLASVTWVAVRSFAGTLLVLIAAGVLLGGLSAWFLREYHWPYVVLAFVAAFAESLAAGVFLGGKRALAMAIVHALGVLRLGRSLVRLIFERMFSIDEDGDIGRRGSRIARGIERLPLARAEELLARAVQTVTGDTAQSGWLRRKVQGRLLNTVGKYTLARFRDDAAKQGGIDLLKLKDELEQTVDDALVRRFRGGFRTVTVLVLLGLPLLVAIQTWVILRFCDQTSGNSL